MQRNMGGVLLFSSFEGSISELHMKNIFLNTDDTGDSKTFQFTKNSVQSPLSDGKPKHGRYIIIPLGLIKFCRPLEHKRKMDVSGWSISHEMLCTRITIKTNTSADSGEL